MTRYSTEFWVAGVPRPKGSLIPICPNRQRMRCPQWPCRPHVTEDYRSDGGKRLRAWMRAIVTESKKHRPSRPLTGAVLVDIEFFFRRPAATKHAWPIARADVDKLERAVFDALQVKGRCGGCIMVDDGQIVDGRRPKRWGDSDGVRVRVVQLEAEQEEIGLDQQEAL